MKSENDREKPNPKSNRAKNIRFLRNQIGISTNQLAVILEIDPLILYKNEQDHYDTNFLVHSNIKALVDIANYFAIKLDELEYSDIEIEKLVSNKWFHQLIIEMTSGEKADRKKFNKGIYNSVLTLPQVHSREEFSRFLLAQLHQIAKIENRYHNLRDACRIEKNDFFEPLS